MRAGFRYVRHARPLLRILVRAGAFFLFASAPWALLPLLVRQEWGAGPTVYGLLLGAIGGGAVAGAFLLPTCGAVARTIGCCRWRRLSMPG